MESSSPGPVVFEVEGRVGRLRLNRPEKLNALNDEVRLALGEALDELEERPEVSVLVVQPDRASPPAMATIAVVRHQRPTFGRS